MRYYLFFGSICVTLTGFIHQYVYAYTDWHFYVVWVVALSGGTLAVYGLDKLLSKVGGLRAPEDLLHLLALLGGSPGGWAGMVIFKHKTNYREHPFIWLYLVLGTLGHAALAYYLFFRGN